MSNSQLPHQCRTSELRHWTFNTWDLYRIIRIIYSDCLITSANFFPTASANSSMLAFRIFPTVPNFCFNNFLVFGPMPIISSSADFTACLLRSCRWKVIPNRWASSRSLCSNCKPGWLWSRIMGTGLFGRKISSILFARPMTGIGNFEF